MPGTQGDPAPGLPEAPLLPVPSHPPFLRASWSPVPLGLLLVVIRSRPWGSGRCPGSRGSGAPGLPAGGPGAQGSPPPRRRARGQSARGRDARGEGVDAPQPAGDLGAGPAGRPGAGGSQVARPGPGHRAQGARRAPGRGPGWPGAVCALCVYPGPGAVVGPGAGRPQGVPGASWPGRPGGRDLRDGGLGGAQAPQADMGLYLGACASAGAIWRFAGGRVA